MPDLARKPDRILLESGCIDAGLRLLKVCNVGEIDEEQHVNGVPGAPCEAAAQEYWDEAIATKHNFQTAARVDERAAVAIFHTRAAGPTQVVKWRKEEFEQRARRAQDLDPQEKVL